MKKFSVATWNVNSLRVRLPHVLDWLSTVKPDVLGLQELKLPTEDFPLDAIREAGYEAFVNGQKTWNGVALLIRHHCARDIIDHLPGAEDPQKRLIAATINDIRILNLYIPNGESVGSEKFKYKLAWLKRLERFIKSEQKKFPKMLLLGDFNIAPQPEDVHDPARWKGQVLFSEPERTAFQRLLSLGFSDCFRLHPQAEKTFSWWDYRLNAFKRNMGLRIDHILATKPLASQCRQCYIDKDPRTWERPSDHAPVVASFAEK